MMVKRSSSVAIPIFDIYILYKLVRGVIIKTLKSVVGNLIGMQGSLLGSEHTKGKLTKGIGGGSEQKMGMG